MGKSISNEVFDAMLQYIIDNCDKITLCNAQPTTFAEGNATFALADHAMAAGDFSIADGDTSGRKLVVAAQAGVTVDTAGTSTHFAYLDTTNSVLLAVTETAAQGLATPGTVDIGSHDLEVNDPT